MEAPTAKIPQSTSSEQHVVELQYSEFKPPSGKEESHPPVMYVSNELFLFIHLLQITDNIALTYLTLYNL